MHAHRERFGAEADDDLLIGLQLTHSGRFARPDVYDRPAPLTASVHPILDRRFPDGVRLLEDDELDRLVGEFVQAATAGSATPGSHSWTSSTVTGISVTRCSGRARRPGRYGGSLENRTRFMRDIIEGIHAEVRVSVIGVRLSVFDTVPYRKRCGWRTGSRIRARPVASGSACSARRAWTRRSTMRGRC